MSDYNKLIGMNEIKLPVSIAPLGGKHYGTNLLDATGRIFLTIWTATGEPSEREKAQFGDNWTPKFWQEYCCDSHWECDDDWRLAQSLLTILNAAMIPEERKISNFDRHNACCRPHFSSEEIRSGVTEAICL